MENNIVQIDLAKVDREIASLNEQINTLINVKKYAEKFSLGKSNEIPESIVSAIQPIDKPVNIGLGVSAFILSFLEQNGKVDTKKIIQAFANANSKTYAQVSGNVSNALSRLKTLHKINNESKPGGRKAGSVWFLINKK